MVHQEHVKHLEHLVNGESEKHNTQLRQKKLMIQFVDLKHIEHLEAVLNTYKKALCTINTRATNDYNDWINRTNKTCRTTTKYNIRVKDEASNMIQTKAS